MRVGSRRPRLNGKVFQKPSQGWTPLGQSVVPPAPPFVTSFTCLDPRDRALYHPAHAVAARPSAAQATKWTKKENVEDWVT